jgi:hypothetical protein
MSLLIPFIKTYWKGLLISTLLFIVCFFWWQDHKSLIRAYDASVTSYETRITGLKESYERESTRKQESLDRYKFDLEVLEEDYITVIELLNEEKTERVEELILMRREDPEELISRIENKFGFEYVE